MKISALVILYYPDQTIIENILSYSAFADKVYILDNSENPSASLVEAITGRIPNNVYIHDGHNEGIAKRLNQVGRMAKAAGCDYLLTMDQDTSFDRPTIENYFQCFANYPNRQDVAMFGVQYENPHWVSDTCTPAPWTQLITSGSLVNLSLFDVIGGFDENLFIDTVDFEYCYRALVKGHPVILFKNIIINHNLGSTAFSATAKTPQTAAPTLHSPVRLYYMLRNYLYLERKYKQHFPAEMLQSRQAVFNRIKNNLLHNRKRLSVLRFIARAVIDFRKNRMGKYQH